MWKTPFRKSGHIKNYIDSVSKYLVLLASDSFSHAAPNPPVILSVTAIDTHSVRVTWRAPTQPNGVLNSYTIIYHIDYGSDAAIDVHYNGRMVCSYYVHVNCIYVRMKIYNHFYALQTQSYDITGLAPYQLVTVTIIAINDGGTSGNSNVMMNRSNESSKSVLDFKYSEVSIISDATI